MKTSAKKLAQKRAAKNLRDQVYRAAIKARLTEELGAACANCRAKDRLQFDLIHPVVPRPGTMSSTSRLALYSQLHKLGNVRLLCEPCFKHKLKTGQLPSTPPPAGL